MTNWKSVKEVANDFGVSISYIYKLLNKSRIKASAVDGAGAMLLSDADQEDLRKLRRLVFDANDPTKVIGERLPDVMEAGSPIVPAQPENIAVFKPTRKPLKVPEQPNNPKYPPRPGGHYVPRQIGKGRYHQVWLKWELGEPDENGHVCGEFITSEDNGEPELLCEVCGKPG